MCVGGGGEGANIAQFIPGPLVNLSSCTIYSGNVYTKVSNYRAYSTKSNVFAFSDKAKRSIQGPVVQSTAKASHIFSTKDIGLFEKLTSENLTKR